MDDRKKQLRDIIAAKSFSKGGDFKLASGQSSGFYFDMKPTVMDPEGAPSGSITVGFMSK